jgi:hypothetical protein
MLKNHAPTDFRERIEVSGKDGGALSLELILGKVAEGAEQKKLDAPSIEGEYSEVKTEEGGMAEITDFPLKQPVEPHHSTPAQASRCFYCGRVGQAWFQCDCDTAKAIAKGTYSKPKVLIKNGKTLVVHDERLIGLVDKYSGFPRYKPPVTDKSHAESSAPKHGVETGVTRDSVESHLSKSAIPDVTRDSEPVTDDAWFVSDEAKSDSESREPSHTEPKESLFEPEAESRGREEPHGESRPKLTHAERQAAYRKRQRGEC